MARRGYMVVMVFKEGIRSLKNFDRSLVSFSVLGGVTMVTEEVLGIINAVHFVFMI